MEKGICQSNPAAIFQTPLWLAWPTALSTHSWLLSEVGVGAGMALRVHQRCPSPKLCAPGSPTLAHVLQQH